MNNKILSVIVAIVIGIALIPILVIIADSSLSGNTLTVETENDLTYANLPIQIEEGDQLVFTLETIRQNVAYTEEIRNDITDPTEWGFSWNGIDGYIVTYANINFEFVGGTWDSQVFASNYSDEYISWVTVGTVGTLTFLQDWQYPIEYIYRSTTGSTPQTSFANIDNISAHSVLLQYDEIPDPTSKDRLINLIPFMAVGIIIITSTAYVLIKKS